MKSSEVVQIFKGAIKSTKQQGIDKVSIKDLEAYAESVNVDVAFKSSAL